MTDNEAPTIRALTTLLRETLFRADEEFAYVLNRGELGFVETLRALTPEVASTPPGPGRKTIAAHANHVLYGIELANRALAGEPGVHERADWSQAWKMNHVTRDVWRDLIDRIDQQSRLLMEQSAQPREWDEISLTGVFAIAAHTAYHLGAIRQMLRDLPGAI